MSSIGCHSKGWWNSTSDGSEAWTGSRLPDRKADGTRPVEALDSVNQEWASCDFRSVFGRSKIGSVNREICHTKLVPTHAFSAPRLSHCPESNFEELARFRELGSRIGEARCRHYLFLCLKTYLGSRSTGSGLEVSTECEEFLGLHRLP